MTPKQRKQDYNLRTELKRCPTAGEPDLVIRNGKLITKLPRPTIAAAVATVADGTVQLSQRSSQRPSGMLYCALLC